MKIAIGCDHGGYILKEALVEYLKKCGHEVKDFGTYSTDSVDYSDYAHKVALGVSKKEFDRGVVVCSTGIGVSIVANKVNNIRCALVHDKLTASLTRQHNDSNIIAFGAKIISVDLAKEILEIWLNTEFEGGRHSRRINKISLIEGTAKIHVLNNPLINDKMARLRNKDTNPKEFKELVGELSGLMMYEASKNFTEKAIKVQTPLSNADCFVLSNKIVVVPILRAGIGMLDGILKVIPQATVGHIGLYRDEKTLQPTQYYIKLPNNIDNAYVILVDPMLATGGSAIKAISLLKENGVNNIIYMGLIGSKEGIEKLSTTYPDVNIYLASCDEKLNEDGYIVPGLGDCGDRIFGTK